MKSPTSVVFQCFALVLLVVLLALSVPQYHARADANPPTETNTPAPTETETPQPTNTSPPEGSEATDTAVPIFPTNTPNNAGPESQPTSIPVPPSNGGLSTLDRILLVLLAFAVVIVIGVIVYLVYYQTRGEGGLDDR